jgi:hypothetical protein
MKQEKIKGEKKNKWSINLNMLHKSLVFSVMTTYGANTWKSGSFFLSIPSIQVPSFLLMLVLIWAYNDFSRHTKYCKHVAFGMITSQSVLNKNVLQQVICLLIIYRKVERKKDWKNEKSEKRFDDISSYEHYYQFVCLLLSNSCFLYCF